MSSASPQPRPVLSAMERAQVAFIAHTFSDVWPDPLDTWERNFRGGPHPVNDITVWTAMAVVYRRFGLKGNVSLAQKHEIASLLLSRTLLPTDEVLKRARAGTLAKAEVRKILERFDQALVRLHVSV